MHNKTIVIIIFVLCFVPNISFAQVALNNAQLLHQLEALTAQLVSLQEQLRQLKIENAQKIKLQTGYFSGRGTVDNDTYSFKIKTPKNWEHYELGTAHVFGKENDESFDGPGITILVWSDDADIQTAAETLAEEVASSSDAEVLILEELSAGTPLGWLIEFERGEVYERAHLFTKNNIMYEVSVSSRLDEWEMYADILTASLDSFRI